MKRPTTLNELLMFEQWCTDIRPIIRENYPDEPITSELIHALWEQKIGEEPTESPKGMPHSQHTEDANEIERKRNDKLRRELDIKAKEAMALYLIPLNKL